MSKEGKDLKTSYQWEAITQWREPPLAGPVGVIIKLFFRNNLRRDIDNWNKILFDSLTGIAWIDDHQINKMSIEKFVDKAVPRIEIEIYETKTNTPENTSDQEPKKAQRPTKRVA